MRIDRRTLIGGAMVLAGAPAVAAHVTDWHALGEEVRAEMAWAWDLYRRHAWGKDEIKPLTGGSSSFPLKGHHLGLGVRRSGVSRRRAKAWRHDPDPTALHEDENADAMKLDIHRRRIQHMTFGGGPHRCAGMHLARMEAIVMLQEWLKRIPEFHVATDANPTFRLGIIAAVDNIQLEWTPLPAVAA